MDPRQRLASLKLGQEVAIVRDTPTARRGGISTRSVKLATVQGVNEWQATVQCLVSRFTARGGPMGIADTGDRPGSGRALFSISQIPLLPDKYRGMLQCAP